MKIAIKGHKSRGKEVIQILESLGTKDILDHTGSNEEWYYMRNDSIRPGVLIVTAADETFLRNYGYQVYTLEEFEKEFPFKVGDKVTIVGLPDFPKVITQMAWDCDEILYSFEGLVNTWYGAKALKRFEMKEERNITLTLDKAKEWYKKGGELREVALQAFSEKELNPLPRSWEEFCEKYPIKTSEAVICTESTIVTCDCSEIRDPDCDREICPSIKSAEAHLAMIQLEQLRDCWWNGWEPEWNNSEKYVIKWEADNLIVFTAKRIHAFLVFPTREMAEEFLECFGDLIEKAGDLI